MTLASFLILSLPTLNGRELTESDERLSDEVAIVLDGGHLSQGVDLLQVPLWFHLEVDVDLLCLDAFGSCQQAHPLTRQRGVSTVKYVLGLS